MNWYARIAPVYDLICRPLYAKLRTAAVDALQLNANQRVVEIGCGTGLNIAALSKKSRQVITVDRTAKMLNCAPQCFDNVSMFWVTVGPSLVIPRMRHYCAWC